MPEFQPQAELEPHAAVYNWVIAACRASQGFSILFAKFHDAPGNDCRELSPVLQATNHP